MKPIVLITVVLVSISTLLEAQQIKKSGFKYYLNDELVKTNEAFELLKTNPDSKTTFTNSKTAAIVCGLLCVTSASISFQNTTNQLTQSQSGGSSKNSDASQMRAVQFGLLGAAIPLAILSNLQMKKSIQQFNNSYKSSMTKPHLEFGIGLFSGGFAYRF